MKMWLLNYGHWVRGYYQWSATLGQDPVSNSQHRKISKNRIWTVEVFFSESSSKITSALYNISMNCRVFNAPCCRFDGEDKDGPTARNTEIISCSSVCFGIKENVEFGVKYKICTLK